MNTLKLRTLKTKSFWTGIASIATGISLIIAGNIPEGALAVVGGIGLIANRDAQAKVEEKIEKL